MPSESGTPFCSTLHRFPKIHIDFMSRFSPCLALLCAATFAACSTTDSEMPNSEMPAAPDAKKIPLELTDHGENAPLLKELKELKDKIKIMELVLFFENLLIIV